MSTQSNRLYSLLEQVVVFNNRKLGSSSFKTYDHHIHFYLAYIL